MPWSFFLFPLLCLHSAFANLVTTIDDAFVGDTQSSISYSPLLAWVDGSAANHGRIAPDASQAQSGTWHDTTDDTSPGLDGTTPTFMEVNFHGTGIDIRCIIVNNKNDPSILPFTGTKANYSFFIDTVPQNRDFAHEAGTTGVPFLYNTSVFSTTGLSNGPHTLKLLLNGGLGVDGSVLLLFDYAIVTSDTATSPPDTNPSSAGGTPPLPATTTSISASGTPSTSSSSQSRTTGSGVSTATAGGVIQNPSPTNTSSAQSASAHSSSSSPAQSSPSSPALSAPAHKFNIVAIVGGLGGGLLVLLLLLLIFWLRRRRPHRPPTILPFPNANGRHSSPILRSFLSLKREGLKRSPHSFPPHYPNPPPQSTVPSSAGIGAQSNSDSAMRDYVQTLQAEVELLRLRDQQQQMVISFEPPPRYEDT